MRKEEKDDLEWAILHSDDSFVLKSWKEITVSGKIIRVLIVSVLYWGAIYMDYQRGQENEELQSNHVKTEAQILSIEEELGNKQKELIAKYVYKVDGIEFIDTWGLSSGYVISSDEKNGFLIVEGDEFMLKYSVKDPTHNRIDFNTPIKETKARYIDEVQRNTHKLFPDSIVRNCVVENVVAAFGLQGIVTLNNYNKGYWDNEDFNKYKYGFLTYKEKYKAILDECTK